MVRVCVMYKGVRLLRVSHTVSYSTHKATSILGMIDSQSHLGLLTKHGGSYLAIFSDSSCRMGVGEQNQALCSSSRTTLRASADGQPPLSHLTGLQQTSSPLD